MQARAHKNSSRSHALGAWLLAGWLAGAPAAAVADDDRRPGHEEMREHRERLMDQALDQMRALRVWKITEELKLDEATAAKLFPLLASYDEQMRPLGRERQQTHRALREALGQPTPDAPRIDALVDALLANRARMTALEDDRVKATRKVLTSVQHAKLLLLMPKIEEDFRRRIREAMGGDKGGGRPHERFGRGNRGEAPPPPNDARRP